MKKIIISIIIILMASCLKPPRDNEFDPKNPDKAYLTGVVASPYGKERHAKVRLLTSEYELYDSTFSDDEGRYEFSHIDPGIYKIMAFALYHLPVEYYPESLPAGTSDTVDLYFSTMLFDFDSDTVGTIEPFDFQRVIGNWRVQNDNSAPSLPNIYNCFGRRGLALYNPTVENFSIGIEFKINTSFDSFSQVGVVLRLQDSLNFYGVTVSSVMLSFWKIVDGGYTIIDNVPILLAHNEWYKLWVDVYDTQFKVYFNDELKIDTNDDEFSAGKTGLLVEREGQNPISVNFDNVVIYQ
ncbi:MAG: carboxypeptidase-like regulatory domain-containing protein [bacterium]